MKNSAVSKRATGLACAIGAAAAWGLGGVFVVPGLDRGVSPSAVASARVLVASLVLLIVLAIWKPALLLLPKPARVSVAAYGLTLAPLGFTFYYAIDRIPYGVAIALQFTAPVMVLMWTSIVHKKKHHLGVWLSAGLTVLGVAIISGAFSSNTSLNFSAVVMSLISAGFLSAVFLISERIGTHGLHPATTVFWGFIISTLSWSVITPWWNWPVEKLSSPIVVWSILGVAIVGTLFSFFLNAAAARLLPSSTVGVATTTEPVFGTVFAWILLDQHLTAIQISGGLLILFGVLLIERLTRHEAAANADLQIKDSDLLEPRPVG